MVKYSILSNNRRSKLHAVIDCLFFFFCSLEILICGTNYSEELYGIKNEDQAFEVDNKDFKLHNLYYVYKYLCSSSLHAKSLAGNCDQYSL